MGKTKHGKERNNESLYLLVVGLGLLALLVASITYATNHDTSSGAPFETSPQPSTEVPTETLPTEDTQFVEEEPEVTYDIALTGVEDPVYGVSKGKKGLLLATHVENNVDGKAKTSIKIRCQAQPAIGNAFDMGGEYVKNFKTKLTGAEKRRFFYPLNEQGSLFMRRIPTDGGTVVCTLNLPNYIKIKKETFQDSNPENDAAQVTINWANRQLRGSFELMR